MKTLKKIFLETEMTWKRVIVFSLVCGIVTGLLMLPDFLDDTSLQMPGISYEFWIFFALYIALNCDKPFEAGLKTFVGFVISQPVIYLAQVPFSEYGWQLMRYYPSWIIPTILTFPGGAVAWFTKKGNLLSAFILSIANAILCTFLPFSVSTVIESFPHMLLTTLFMAGEILVFTLLLLPKKRERVLAFAIAAIVLAIFTWKTVTPSQAYSTYTVMGLEGDAPFEVISEEPLFQVSIDGENMHINYHPYELEDPGSAVIRYRDAAGTEYEIPLEYGDGQCNPVE